MSFDMTDAWLVNARTMRSCNGWAVCEFTDADGKAVLANYTVEPGRSTGHPPDEAVRVGIGGVRAAESALLTDAEFLELWEGQNRTPSDIVPSLTLVRRRAKRAGRKTQ